MTSSQPTDTPKIVFVVGAGASNEVSLPIGEELKKSIARALDIRFGRGTGMISGDSLICEAIRIAVAKPGSPSRDINPHLHAAWLIRDAMPLARSIDNFIDAHYDDKKVELCGKLAIVRAILEAESNSSLYINSNNSYNKLNFDQSGNTWLNSFMRLLTDGCRLPDLEKRLSSVAFVIFNYDRCVEHYLYHAIQKYYSLSASDAASLLQHLEIYHPYGTVGSLPWQGPSNIIEFGETPRSEQLLHLAGQIKTFTEGTNESSSDIGAIRRNIHNARRIIFLGFAFHRMNLDLLMPWPTPPETKYEKRMFATAMGISASDVESIKPEICNRSSSASMSHICIRNDLTCSGLLREYGRSLSLFGV